MQTKFEAKYQELAEELKLRPWMQVIPKASQLSKDWNVDRWAAGAFSTYAVERMNGKSEDEAMAYTKKMNQRADFDNPPSREALKPIADTDAARKQFEQMVTGR